MDVDSITCPKCGYVNNFLSEECVNCGITFAIFSEIHKRKKKQEPPPDAGDEAVAQGTTCPQCGFESPDREKCPRCGIIFAKYFEIQERERVEALKREQEEKAREEARRREEEQRAREEARRREQEERERAEALKREQEEKAREEARRREQEERERAEALKREQEKKAREEARRREEEQRAREEARRRKQEERERAEALKREQEEKARAAAESSTRLRQPETASLEIMLKGFEGQMIGVNYDDPNRIKGGRLIRVHDNYLSIYATEAELIYHFPLRNIISVAEGPDGVGISVKGEKSAFPIVLRVLQPKR